MERKTEFNVGDKVICENVVGQVINITPKRKDIKVDFGSYTLTFDFDGWIRGDIWTTRQIEKWTPEKQKIIDDKKVIYKCRNMFGDISRRGELTPDIAKKIMAILNERMDEQIRQSHIRCGIHTGYAHGIQKHCGNGLLQRVRVEKQMCIYSRTGADGQI